MKLLIVLLCIVTSALADPLQTRPPWEVELVAAAPDIVHPSVVCTAPDGRIFVAEDPMDIREDTPPDALKGRIICFHPDGKRTVFAEGLHAVFGMQYLEGNLYVLHNPRLTVFRDATGVGHDILTHTLAEPWALGWNDHIPANFKLGMDGWFYLAVGDKGLHGCTGSDGRKVDLNGGGIVRFRPDGSGLEIFASGVRNILDVALDAEDEFFTYDNTDEHHWMGRLTHMVEAGFYGYPHDFIPRRPYTLWMMHDFGAGAACGTLANTDDALPPAFAGNLFLSDFGKRQVTRVRVEREGATFRMAQAEELFLNPPDDFRPVGLCWSADGRSILICDWQHRDGKENVSVGRLWKLTWRGDSNAAPRPAWWIPLAMGQTAEVKSADLIAALVHPARSVRLSAQRALAALGDNETHAGLIQLLNDNTKPAVARMHALWSLDMLDEAAGSRASVLALAEGNDAALASQALRQLSQRRVTAAAPVAMRALASNSPAVRLQAATLLGRLANESASEPLLAVLDGELDGVVRYALHTALRRIAEARPVVVNQIAAGLSSSSARLREGCELALREFYSERLVSLLGVLSTSEDAVTAEAALRLLAPLSLRAPNRPFQWWAYHPASTPAPPRTERWAGSDRVLSAIRDVVGDPRPALREK
ncbi:MAG: HEAT repeat domain-containing protein, partial [Verrucomicrobiota bacterium]